MTKLAIAQRFKEYGISLCGSERGWKKQYAQRLGLSSIQMSNILKGRDPIGGIIQSRLRDLGADVEYILTGKSRVPKHYEINLEGTSRSTSSTEREINKIVADLKETAANDPTSFPEKVSVIKKMLNMMSKQSGRRSKH